MTETLAVPELIIDSWPEQRLSQQELRATLTYLAYKTGKPVHFRKYAAQQHFSDKLVMLYVCTQDSCPFPADSPKLRLKGVDYGLAASQPLFRAEELQGTVIADDEGTILAKVEQNCITVLVEFTGEDNQAARALLAYVVEEAPLQPGPAAPEPLRQLLAPGVRCFLPLLREAPGSRRQLMAITSPAELFCLFYPNQFEEDPTVKYKPQERQHPAPEALPRNQSDGKQFLDQPLQRKPHWPLGLQLSAKKDVTCFIPEHLAVILSPEAFEQLFTYAYSTTSEICCLGTVRQEAERFRVERFYLVSQTGSSGHTELDQEALAVLVEELLARGKSQEARSIRCWSHSHPGMGLFWSKTDEDTCKRLVTDYLVILVVSDSFAIRCRVDVGGPVPFAIDQVPVLVEVSVEATALERYAAEVREKVKYEPLLPCLEDREDGKFREALVPEYCDTCGWVHLKGHCPLSEEAGDPQTGEEHGTQPGLDLLETGDDPTLFALDEESWF